MHIKSLAIAAAAVMAVGSAQAADLNKPAKVAVDYVKICDAYGAGFFYIPGSDTCLKIGGFVRFDAAAGYTDTNSDVGAFGFHNGIRSGVTSTRNSNVVGDNIRADTTFDARTNTPYGLLRSFIDFHSNLGTTTNNTSRTSVELDSGFIQLGGLTAGRASSNYNFLYNSNIDWQFEAFTDYAANQLAYTYSFGNGVSATLAVEDPTTTGYQSTGSAYNPGRKSGASFTYGALSVPDIIGNIKVSQAWGSAQLSGGLHQDYGSAATPYTKMGYGIQAGVNFNVPMLGAGDTFGVQGAYSVGATNFAYSYSYQGGTGAGASYISSADLGADAAVNNGSLKQARMWTIGAALAHHFTPTVEFDLTPAYYAVTNSNTAGALNYQAFELGTQINWTPVKGMAIIPDFEYRNIHTSGSTRAAGNAIFGNASAYVFDLRLQRTF